MGKKTTTGTQAAHRVCLNEEEYSLLCWLRLHPDTAAKYGIKKCHGHTRVGSMLMQMLAWMGAVVEWKAASATAQPATATAATTHASSNLSAAGFVTKIKARPGRKPKAAPQPVSHAPPEAAIIVKKKGRPRNISFPLFVRLSRARRKKQFTSRGNLMAAPTSVALVQVCVAQARLFGITLLPCSLTLSLCLALHAAQCSQISTWVNEHCRCKCGGRLKFCEKASSQVLAGPTSTRPAGPLAHPYPPSSESTLGCVYRCTGRGVRFVDVCMRARLQSAGARDIRALAWR